MLVKPPTVAVPPKLYVSKTNENQQALTLLIYRIDHKRFTIPEITESPGLTTIVATNQAGLSYTLKVVLGSKPQEYPADTKLMIHTDDTNFPILEVPILFR